MIYIVLLVIIFWISSSHQPAIHSLIVQPCSFSVDANITLRWRQELKFDPKKVIYADRIQESTGKWQDYNHVYTESKNTLYLKRNNETIHEFKNVSERPIHITIRNNGDEQIRIRTEGIEEGNSNIDCQINCYPKCHEEKHQESRTPQGGSSSGMTASLNPNLFITGMAVYYITYLSAPFSIL